MKNPSKLSCLLIAGTMSAAISAQAAVITSLVDNFDADTISADWMVSNAPFETGAGTYTSDTTTNANQLTIGGVSTSNWWGGQSLDSVNTFSSSLETVVLVDRVSISGTGTGYRSALEIESAGGQTLFFNQLVEGATRTWNYNASSTGGGTNIAAFDAQDTNLGNLEMKLVYKPLGGTNADVEIYLNGALGITHSFTNWDNSTDFTVRLGSYTRSAGASDTSTTVFDNFSAVAIPEPGTYALIGGCLALGYVMVRRR